MWVCHSVGQKKSHTHTCIHCAFLLMSYVLHSDVVMDLLNPRLSGHLTPWGGLLAAVMTIAMGAFAFNICSQLLINLFISNTSVLQPISPIHNSTQPFEEVVIFASANTPHNFCLPICARLAAPRGGSLLPLDCGYFLKYKQKSFPVIIMLCSLAAIARGTNLLVNYALSRNGSQSERRYRT